MTLFKQKCEEQSSLQQKNPLLTPQSHQQFGLFLEQTRGRGILHSLFLLLDMNQVSSSFHKNLSIGYIITTI